MNKNFENKKTASTEKHFFYFILILTIFLSGCSINSESIPFLQTISNNSAGEKTEQPPALTGNNASAVQSTPEAGAAAVPAGAVTATPEPTPSVYTIKLWVPPEFDIEQDTPAGKALSDAISIYMSEHPQINIVVRVKASNGEGSMLNTITAANQIAKDVLPSLALMSRVTMETCVLRNLLQPIETSVFSDSDTWYNFAKQSAVVDNNTYGIPILGDGLVITYRKAKVGADLGDWQDILGRGLPIAFTPSTPNSPFASFMYITMGGNILNDLGQPYLDQNKLTDTLYFFLGGGQNGSFPPSIAQLADQNQAWQKFNDGTYSILITPLSSFRHYKTSELSVRSLPLQIDANGYPMINTWNLVLLEDNPIIQGEAVKFAEYLSESTVNNDLSFFAGYLPVRNNDHSNFQNDPEYDLIRMISENGVLIPSNEVSGKIVPALNNAVTQIIKNQSTPEDAAKEAVNSIN